MESIVAVLAEIEILTSSSGDDRAARKDWVDDERGLKVKAWIGDRLASQFVIGRSTREHTYIGTMGDERIVTVQGRCRPIFDKTVDELRHPVITQFAVTEIERVRYDNPHGVLELVAAPAETGRFVPKGTTIRNFYGERASQQIGVLAHLLARGFVDAPEDPDETGLFSNDTPRATLFVRTAHEVRAVDVWVGKRTRDNRLHLRTSEGEQIYLVSAHLETSLVPRRSHFERSDEMMKGLRAQQDEERRETGERGSRAHDHEHPRLPASQIPPEMMGALRALARDQRKRR